MVNSMKKIIVVYLCLLLLFVIPTDSYAKIQMEDPKAINAITLESPSAILIEASTGTVLYEKNADEALRPASVTKVMTLLLIFEKIDEGVISYDDVVTISEHAASMGGSQCFFEQGEQQTVKDLIKCIEVSSGNDAAVAMGEYIGGSEQGFVILMNEKAKELGMNNTNFANACGLEAEGHVTSARDIAIMSRELTTNYPEIFDYSKIWMDSIIHKTAKGESVFDLANTNKFMKEYNGATGLKTGYTSQAGYCMSATASRNDVDLIAVIMGAATKDIRNDEAGKLLDYGFAMCNVYTDDEGVSNDVKFNVTNGEKKYGTIEDVGKVNVVLIGTKADNITKKIEINKKIIAPIKKGDVIGKVSYYNNGNAVKEVPLFSSCDIKKMTIKSGIKIVFNRLLIIGE